MSSDVIISVENLGKKYRISHQGERQRYTALRDVLANKVKGLFRPSPLRLDRGEGQGEVFDAASNRKSAEDFWALRDVSFEVRRGEVVGIIGRNGAGKSTLLKILSRITEPTTGHVHLKGRVASLLEVGTGFHPELTGRENIFLNGAILGMSRAEIRKKFDEIVAFAEVEKFLDTPVKRYSSGMYVRLAFAVAAHLEPEILIVDEVLAVGDAEFQKKCLGKMGEVAKGGRTVLFVSHNLSAVLNLCSRGLLLSEGRLVMADESKKVCAAYADTWQNSKTLLSSNGLLKSISLLDSSGIERSAVLEGDSLHFCCGIRVPQERCLVSLIVRDARNAPLFELFDNSFSPPFRKGMDVTVNVEANILPLLPGHYYVDFWLGDKLCNRIEGINNACEFDVIASAKSETSLPLTGAIRCNSKWNIQK